MPPRPPRMSLPDPNAAARSRAASARDAFRISFPPDESGTQGSSRMVRAGARGGPLLLAGISVRDRERAAAAVHADAERLADANRPHQCGELSVDVEVPLVAGCRPLRDLSPLDDRSVTGPDRND